LFNILDLLRYCDKRDMAKEFWIARYEFENLARKDQNDYREMGYLRYE
jgi:hypothetical protein